MIITPETALKELVASFDEALVALDKSGEHFGHAVLNIESAIEGKTKEQQKELLILIENYVLMSGFLLDHPLLSVIKQIRETSKIAESDTNVMALQHAITKGQCWRHYKGATYTVTSVAKDSNHPYIHIIHYEDESGENTWSLPVHEFAKMVEWEGQAVPRFKYIS